MKPGMRLQMSTCWSSWSASACSSTQEKTRGRSCGSSRCLPPSAAAQSLTSTTACRRCGCGSSLKCTLWPGSLNNSSSSSSSRRTVCSSPWNEKQCSVPSHEFWTQMEVDLDSCQNQRWYAPSGADTAEWTIRH